MKWFTHQTLAVASAIALGLPSPAIGGTVVGAILPDMIDQSIAKCSRTPQKTFWRIHRGSTHWFGWYLALLLLTMNISAKALPSELGTMALRADIIQVGMGIAFGGLAHILLDMLTPSGVPLQPFSKKHRFSLRLCSTGSVGEYIFLVVSLVVLTYFTHDSLPDLARIARRFF